jgi:Fic-DOC domain mobile mystery protein B
MELDSPEGTTPLTRSQLEYLLPTHITTREELNFWEGRNILDATNWLAKAKPKNILNEAFIKKLHKRMFGDVWKWAGVFRQEELVETNFGVPYYKILEELYSLLANVEEWIKRKSYPVDELGVRFHHRLVSIHPFPNGNGRHARLMGDLLNENVLGQRPYTWGGGNLSATGDLQNTYLQALKAADNYDYAPMLRFARSK